MLEFGAKLPFSVADFLELCRGQLDSRDMVTIEDSVADAHAINENSCLTLTEWKRFETALRNEVAKQRAARSAKDPSKYIRGDGYSNPFETGFAHWAISQDSPIEAERYLDRVRWDKAEDLGREHYFDIDFLITYVLKLKILERWQAINKEDGTRILEDIIRG